MPAAWLTAPVAMETHICSHSPHPQPQLALRPGWSWVYQAGTAGRTGLHQGRGRWALEPLEEETAAPQEVVTWPILRRFSPVLCFH